MGSILHIASQLNTERTYLHPQAVFHKIRRGEPVPLGEEGARKWAVRRDHDRAGGRDKRRIPVGPSVGAEKEVPK